MGNPASNPKNREKKMRQILLAAAAIAACLTSGAHAQVATPLSAYADKDGYLDVQALTCAQLAGTYQEDANYLTSWYSGWYNGLAKKHYANIPRGKEAEHLTIVYCKEHPQKTVIEAIGLVIDEMRQKSGIELSK
jgi:hypothetical protein